MATPAITEMRRMLRDAARRPCPECDQLAALVPVQMTPTPEVVPGSGARRWECPACGYSWRTD